MSGTHPTKAALSGSRSKAPGSAGGYLLDPCTNRFIVWPAPSGTPSCKEGACPTLDDYKGWAYARYVDDTDGGIAGKGACFSAPSYYDKRWNLSNPCPYGSYSAVSLIPYLGFYAGIDTAVSADTLSMDSFWRTTAGDPTSLPLMALNDLTNGPQSSHVWPKTTSAGCVQTSTQSGKKYPQTNVNGVPSLCHIDWATKLFNAPVASQD